MKFEVGKVYRDDTAGELLLYRVLSIVDNEWMTVLMIQGHETSYRTGDTVQLDSEWRKERARADVSCGINDSVKSWIDE